jgi:hypothetical protein
VLWTLALSVLALIVYLCFLAKGLAGVLYVSAILLFASLEGFINMPRKWRFSGDRLRIRRQCRWIFEQTGEIDLAEAQEISAVFPEERPVWTRFAMKKPDCLSITIVGPFRIKTRLFFWRREKVEKKLDIGFDVFRRCTGLGERLVSRASELPDEKSRRFAEKFPPFQKKIKPSVRRPTPREALELAVLAVFALGVALLLFPSPVGHYWLLLVVWICGLFLLAVSRRPLFYYLPAIPRSYWAIELLRAGVVVAALAYILWPIAAAVTMLWIAAWWGWSAAVAKRRPPVRRLWRLAAVFLALFAPLHVTMKMRPSGGLRVEPAVWLYVTHPNPVTVAANGRGLALATADFELTGPAHEKMQARPLRDRFAALRSLLNVIVSILNNYKDGTKPDIRGLVVRIDLAGGAPVVERWRDPLTRRMIPSLLLLGNNPSRLLALDAELEQGSLFIYDGPEPCPIDWQPEFNGEYWLWFPRSACSPDGRAFAILHYDRNTSRGRALTFDAATLAPIGTDPWRDWPRDKATSLTRVVRWDGERARTDSIAFDPPDAPPRRHRMQWIDPQCLYALAVWPKKSANRTARLWRIADGEVLAERAIQTREKDEYSCWWSPRGGRLALFHDREILLLDAARPRWQSIPLANGSDKLTGITGAWSPGGDLFFYFQPGVLGKFYGSQLWRVRLHES